MNRKPRLDDVDSAKGLAIFLVVLGHISGGVSFPPNSEWYILLNRAIYQFHMSFFMFLSGLVFFYTYRPVRTLREYGRYAGRKSWRFAPAYVLFGSLMIAGKVVAQRFLHVDSPPEGFWKGLLETLVRPGHSHASTLWYIYALLAFQLLFPICLRLTADKLEPLLVLGLVLHFIPSSPLFCLDRICELAFVFLVGTYAAAHFATWSNLVDKFRHLTLALFLVALLVAAFYWSTPKYLIALLSIPALHGLCRRQRWRTSSWLLLLGKYTLVIYLVNTMVIGVEKSLLERFHLWTGWQFAAFTPVLLLSGIFVPIWLKVCIFRKIPFLDRITT